MSESSSFPPRLLRTRLYEQVAGQISAWIDANGLQAGDKLPPERELAQRLGVSRATLSQALVALEVVGVTYLFAIARNNGTVDLIARKAVQAVGGRVVLIPWVMLGVTGWVSPAATRSTRC